jgi:hypothetical protein
MLFFASMICLVSEPAAAATPGIASTLEESSNSTPKEMTEGAAEMLGEIDAAVVTVTKLLETAKNDKKKDAELVKCLETKLPQLTTIQEIAGKTNTAMKLSLATGKAGRARGEYRQIAVLFSAGKEVLAAAQGCVKSVAGEAGTSTTSISGNEAPIVEEIEPEIPVDIGPITTAH